MKAKNFAKIPGLALIATTIGGCAFNKKTFDVYWYDSNGSILELDRDVEENSMPEYNGVTPSKATDDSATYTFKGWDKELSPVTSVQKYTAVYDSTPRKYKITWQNYDDSILKEEEVAYGTVPQYNGETPKKPSTLLTDFAFVGWDRTITQVNGPAIYKANFSEVNYEPVYLSYQINKTNHDVTNDNPTAIRKGDTLSLVNATAKGYDFEGWYLDDEYDVKIESNLSHLDHNLTVYGKFVPHTYTITYENSDGIFKEGEENITSVTCEDEPFELYKPTKVGYGFKEWSDSNGKVYSTLEDVCSDLTLKAVFVANQYTITLKYKEKSDEFISIKYDQAVSLPELTKKGYKFVGWFDSRTDEQFVQETYNLLEDVTLYPKWEGPIEYTISYNLNGGETAEQEPEIYTVDMFPNIVEPTRVGYDFIGWYVNGNPFTTFRDHAEDIELTAMWEAHNVAISYNYEGGTLQRNITYQDGEEVVEERLISPFEGSGFISLDDKENAQFKGWKNEKDKFVSFSTNLNVDSDIVLKAEWSQIVDGAKSAKVGEEIEFNSNGASTHVYQFTSLYAQDVKFEINAETFIVASLTNENKSPISGANQSKYSQQFTFESVHLEANKTYFLTIYATGDGEHLISVKTSALGDIDNVLQGQITSGIYTIDATEQKFDEQFVSPGTPVKEGKVFEGWKDENGVLYTEETILKSENIVLHASWIDAE